MRKAAATSTLDMISISDEDNEAVEVKMEGREQWTVTITSESKIQNVFQERAFNG